MQGTSPDDQILNQFARNQKMHIWKKYKTEILLIWRWQIQEYLNRDLAVRESRHVSWFWFLPEEVGRVHAHPWIQVQVHDQHYSTKMIPFITRLRFRAGRLVFSPRRTCPQVSPTSPSWFWTSTSSTLTRQLASSSSMTRRMQRRLPTVWWSWRAASSTSMWTSTTCLPSPETTRSKSNCRMIVPRLYQIDFSQKTYSSYTFYTLGPLCLWQCLFTSSVRRADKWGQKSPNGDQCGSSEWLEKDKKEVEFEKYISRISRERLNEGLIRELHFSN